MNAELTKCPLCRAPIRREEKAEPDRSLYNIDCDQCGVYQIGGTSRATLSTLRDEPFIRALAARIRPANEKGFALSYPTGALIPGHAWLARED